jgi:hypothetical protein
VKREEDANMLCQSQPVEDMSRLRWQSQRFREAFEQIASFPHTPDVWIVARAALNKIDGTNRHAFDLDVIKSQLVMLRKGVGLAFDAIVMPRAIAAWNS